MNDAERPRDGGLPPPTFSLTGERVQEFLFSSRPPRSEVSPARTMTTNRRWPFGRQLSQPAGPLSTSSLSTWCGPTGASSCVRSTSTRSRRECRSQPLTRLLQTPCLGRRA